MLWTAFMPLMFGWMLLLVFQYQLGAMPIVIVLATILAFIKVLRRSTLDRGAGSRDAEQKTR